MLLILVLAVVGWAGVDGQVVGSLGNIVLPHEDHKHLNGCVLPNVNELMAFNESRSLPGVCHLVTCHEDRHITYTRCIAVVLPDNCTLSEFNLTLPYPDCCPIIICHNETETSENTTTTTIKPDTVHLLTNVTDNLTTTNKPDTTPIEMNQNIKNVNNNATTPKPSSNETITKDINDATNLTHKLRSPILKPHKREIHSTTLKPAQNNSKINAVNSTTILSPDLIKKMIAKLTDNNTTLVDNKTLSSDIDNKSINNISSDDNSATVKNKTDDFREDKGKENISEQIEGERKSDKENEEAENEKKSVESNNEHKQLKVMGIGGEGNVKELESSNESSEIAEEVETTLSEKLAKMTENRKDVDHLRSELIIINFYRNN